MAETRRKLTTIFSADVQDYTRLMGADEEGTLATLKRYRDAMARLIEAHDGRVINTWGDGLIAEFASVVEAVRAAVDIQNELAGLNSQRPADGRMLFRIGINLGDVIVEGHDIYGDGVNIAARLQASAAAGGIVISNTVYEQVRNKVAVGFEFLGPLVVKNVEEGVPSYAVRIGETNDGARPPRHSNANANADDRQPRATPESEPVTPGGKMLWVMGVAGAGLIAINLLTWEGDFWAAWPLLALAWLAGLRRASRLDALQRRLAVLLVIGLGIVGINLLSWHGTFWAIWPLLGLALLAGLRWATRR
jgi:class 3 adenylate cyclase